MSSWECKDKTRDKLSFLFIVSSLVRPCPWRQHRTPHLIKSRHRNAKNKKKRNQTSGNIVFIVTRLVSLSCVIKTDIMLLVNMLLLVD